MYRWKRCKSSSARDDVIIEWRLVIIENIVLRPMTMEDQEMVMKWRTLPEITKYMNTDPVIDMDKQRAWFEKQQQDSTCYNWIIVVDDVPVGVTSISKIDKVNRTCTRGTYIAVQEKRSFEMITSVYASQFDFIFDILQLNKIEIEVFLENKNVVFLSKKCGFKQEGILREHIYKNGTYYDIVLLGMTAEDWKERKKNWNYKAVKIII